MLKVCERQSAATFVLSQASHRPSGIALRAKRRGLWREMSWTTLANQMRKFASGLQQLGLNAEGAVLIFGENSIEWIVADLATQLIGARSIVIPPQTRQVDLSESLADVDITVAICGGQEQIDRLNQMSEISKSIKAFVAANMTGMRNYSDPRLHAFEAVLAKSNEFEPLPTGSAAQVGTFSLGSETAPRLVFHDADAVVERAKMVADLHNITSSDRIFCMLSLAFPAARLLDLYAPLSVGATLHLPEAPSSITIDLRESKPTRLTASPRAITKLMQASTLRIQKSARYARAIYGAAISKLQRRIRLNQSNSRPSGPAWWLVGRPVVNKLGLGSCKEVVVIGGPVSQREGHFFWALGVPLRVAYGPVEMLGLASVQWNFVNESTVGEPLNGVEISVDSMGLLSISDPRLLGSGGSGVRTGDVVEHGVNGQLKIIGRATAVSTAPAEPLMALEIQAAISESRWVQHASVVRDGQQRVRALVAIEFEEVASWAAERRLNFTTYRSLAALKEVQLLVAEAIEEAQRKLVGRSTIDSFELLPRPFGVDAGELTSLLQLRPGGPTFP